MNLAQAIGWAIRGHEETGSTHCVVRIGNSEYYMVCQGISNYDWPSMIYCTI